MPARCASNSRHQAARRRAPPGSRGRSRCACRLPPTEPSKSMTRKSPVRGGPLHRLEPRRALAQGVQLLVERALGHLRARPCRPRGPCTRRGWPSAAPGPWPVKVRSPSSGTSSRSSSGSSIGTARRPRRPPPSTSSPSEPLSISCTTASRPTRWTMTSAGALPGRNPGTRTSRPELPDRPLHARWTSSPGTATSSRTRFSSRGVTSAVSAIRPPRSALDVCG